MDGQLHYRFTRQFFPELSAIQAKQINAAIDSRKNSFMEFPQYDWTPQKGHRRKKHDMLSAGLIGMRYGGMVGMQAAMLHSMLDVMSSNVEQTFGAENRDILFALWKKSMSKRY